MSQVLELGNLRVDVVQKDIKNLHLSVYPPAGRVRISAPLRMNFETIRLFAISKLGWIKQQQKKLRAQARETPREYLNRESHYVWGKRYLLEVVEAEAPPSVELLHRKMRLRIRPGTDEAQRQATLEKWYRTQLRVAAEPIIAKQEQRMGVKVARVFVQKMKTKWGSCTPESRSIRLNTHLVQKPLECLEYIVVHELAHLLERRHSAKFQAIVEAQLPHWREIRQRLNESPLGHENWSE